MDLRTSDLLELHSIIRSFLCHQNIVDVALFEPRIGDAQEARARLEFGNILAATITHSSPETAGKLRNHYLDAPFVRHHAFDSLRHQFSLEKRPFLRIAILASGSHGFQRTHSPIDFVASILVQDNFSRALVGASKK